MGANIFGVQRLYCFRAISNTGIFGGRLAGHDEEPAFRIHFHFALAPATFWKTALANDVNPFSALAVLSIAFQAINKFGNKILIVSSTKGFDFLLRIINIDAKIAASKHQTDSAELLAGGQRRLVIAPGIRVIALCVAAGTGIDRYLFDFPWAC